MKMKDEILADVEKFGRLTNRQEDILYSISLRQDELGREPTNLLYDDLKGNDLYEAMIEREFLTYEIFNHGTKHEVASLYVTHKGLNYCILYSDEISERRKCDAAGALKKDTK